MEAESVEPSEGRVVAGARSSEGQTDPPGRLGSCRDQPRRPAEAMLTQEGKKTRFQEDIVWGHLGGLTTRTKR